jgi:hypothetical protein
VFYEPQDADAARRRLNCQEFFGSRISVEFAKEVICYSSSLFFYNT